MSRLRDHPLPEGMFSPAEEAIIDEIYANLSEHLDTKQIMEISFTVGLDQLISRFHATVRTDVDGLVTDATNACAVRIPDAPDA